MAISVEMTVTVPELVISSNVIRHQIEQMMRSKTGPELKREFKKTTEGWKNKPDFSQKFSNKSDSVSVSVWASGTHKNQYALVNYGSPRHDIPAKRGGLLRFQPGYRAATRPRVLSSRSPQRFGAFISSRGIKNHPGFEAREFDITVAKKIAPGFAEDVQRAINIGATRS